MRNSCARKAVIPERHAVVGEEVGDSVGVMGEAVGESVGDSVGHEKSVELSYVQVKARFMPQSSGASVLSTVTLSPDTEIRNVSATSQLSPQRS